MKSLFKYITVCLMFVGIVLAGTNSGASAFAAPREDVQYWESVATPLDALTTEKVDEVTVYLVKTAEDLASISLNNNNFVPEGGVSSRFEGSIIRLENDINLSGRLWTPIGTSALPFAGVFDGNGHTISNMSVDGNYNAGLFGYTQGAEIKRLGLASYQITLDKPFASSSGDQNAAIGAMVARAKAQTKITECFADGAINITDSRLMLSVGGMAAIIEEGSLIKNVSTNSTIRVEQNSSANDNTSVGGIVGENRNSKIYNSMNHSSVDIILTNSSVTNIRLGGIAGFLSGNLAEIINNCSTSEKLAVTTSSNLSYVGYAVGVSNLNSVVKFNKGLKLDSISSAIGYDLGSTVSDNAIFSDVASSRTRQFFETTSWDDLKEWDFDFIWETKDDAFPGLQAFKTFEFALNIQNTYVDVKFGYLNVSEEKFIEVEPVNDIYNIPYGKEFSILARIGSSEVTDSNGTITVDFSKFYTLGNLTKDNNVVDITPSLFTLDNESYQVYTLVANNTTIGIYGFTVAPLQTKNIITVQRFQIGDTFDPNTGMVKSENSATARETLEQNMNYGSKFKYYAVSGGQYSFSHWVIDYVSYDDQGNKVLQRFEPNKTNINHAPLFESPIVVEYGKGFFYQEFILTAIFTDNTTLLTVAFPSDAAKIIVGGNEIPPRTSVRIVKDRKVAIEVVVNDGYSFDVERMAKAIWRMYGNVDDRYSLDIYNPVSTEFNYEDANGNKVYKLYLNASLISDVDSGILLDAIFNNAANGGDDNTWIIILCSVIGVLVIASVVITIIVVKKKKGY